MDTKVQKKVFYNKFSPSSISYSAYLLHYRLSRVQWDIPSVSLLTTQTSPVFTPQMGESSRFHTQLLAAGLFIKADYRVYKRAPYDYPATSPQTVGSNKGHSVTWDYGRRGAILLQTLGSNSQDEDRLLEKQDARSEGRDGESRCTADV
jgi:hypothetical protein